MAAKSTKPIKNTPVPRKLTWAEMSEPCKFGDKCTRGEKCPFMHTVPAQKKAEHKRNHKPRVLKRSEFRPFLKMVEPILARKRTLETERKNFETRMLVSKVDMKTGSKLDVKNEPDPFEDSAKLIEMELKAVRTMMRNQFGNHHFKINLYQGFNFTSSGSGVVDSGATVDPSTLTEFASCAALFDEYRVTSGHLMFNLGSGFNSSSPQSGAIGYDPTNGSAPGSAVGVMQLDTHMHLHLGALGAMSAGSYPFSTPTQHSFEYVVPPGTVTYTTPSGSLGVGSSNWQATFSVTPQPYGWIRIFCESVTASIQWFNGMMEYHTEFRIRE